MGYNYPHFDNELIQGLYNWQSLIGAILALSAALFGARLLLKQINLSEKQEAERQRRRFAAARARMPLLLSEISSYAHEVARYLVDIHGLAGQLGFGAIGFPQQAPTLGSEIPSSLERLIESTGDDRLSTKLSDLLASLQVINARTSEIPRLSPHMVGLQLMFEDYLIQTAEVYADATSLFAYARREVDDISIGQKLPMRSALNLLEVRDHTFDRLHQTAERRYGGNYRGESAAPLADLDV